MTKDAKPATAPAVKQETPAESAEKTAADAAAAAAAAAVTAGTATDTVAAAVVAAAAVAAAPAPPTTPVPTKVIPATPRPEAPRDPNVPDHRDAVVDSEFHRGTMLLQDLIRLHYFLWKKEQQPESEVKKEDTVKKEDGASKGTEEKKPEETKAEVTAPAAKVEAPTDAKAIEELATRLTDLFKKGRQYELSGLKDVPTPFFKGEGRFFEKIPNTENERDEKKKWKCLNDTSAKSYVSSLILKTFQELVESDNKAIETPPAEAGVESEAQVISKSVDTLFANLKALKTGDEERADPRPYDVLFLPVDSGWEESMNYEHQSGNKNLLYLASQHVSVETKESISRVKAAFALVTAKVQVSSGTELVTQNQRFVIQGSASGDSTTTTPGQKLWKNIERNDLAEFAAIFVFEVYLEKRIYEETIIGNNIVDSVGNPVTPGSTQAAMKDLLSPSDANKPSNVPIPNPTTHDVLFGRGYVSDIMFDLLSRRCQQDMPNVFVSFFF